MNPEAIIRTCTRSNVTSWRNVAKMLGMNETTAKAQYQSLADAILGKREEVVL